MSRKVTAPKASEESKPSNPFCFPQADELSKMTDAELIQRSQQALSDMGTGWTNYFRTVLLSGCYLEAEFYRHSQYGEWETYVRKNHAGTSLTTILNHRNLFRFFKDTPPEKYPDRVSLGLAMIKKAKKKGADEAAQQADPVAYKTERQKLADAKEAKETKKEPAEFHRVVARQDISASALAGGLRSYLASGASLGRNVDGIPGRQRPHFI